MKKLLCCVSLIMFLSAQSRAQNTRSIQGTTLDTAGVPLPGLSVKLVSDADSLATATDGNGNFVFPAVKENQFRLTVTGIGFQTFTKKYVVDKESKVVKLKPILLNEAFNMLSEVTVTAITPIKVMEDTVQYDARAYKVREGDAAEEMIKKLPGVEVDKDGNVTVQGEPITKIRVNGKDFFGTDVASAIQNLPADIIKNLQIIDDYGDQAKLTGVKTDEPKKVLNINIQPDKKTGYYTRTSAGLGTEDRYSGRIRGNKFKGERQISFDGSINNISRRGGSNGITETKYARLNYRDEWGSKVSSYGSYGFSNRNNNTVKKVSRQDIYQDYTRFQDQTNNSSSKNFNHQFSWNIEYRIDTNNYLKVSPEIAYTSSSSDQAGLTNMNLLAASSNSDKHSSNDTKSSNLGTDLFYNHKFAKKGRNFNLNASINSSKGNQDRDVQNHYINTDSTGNTSLEDQYQYIGNDNQHQNSRIRLSYMEPLGSSSFLILSYQWSRSNTGSIRDTRDIDPADGQETPDSSLSNNYKYQFTTNRAGLTYRNIHPKYNYTVGLTAQPALLEGQDITRDINTSKQTFNWVPSARFVYKFSRKQTFSARYNGQSNQPSFDQLQPIVDNSDLNNTVSGNPDLKPEFINNLRLEYQQADWESGYTMFTNLSFSQTNNKIVTSKVIIPDSIKQETSYLNADGFYSLRGNYSLSKPFAKRNYTLTYYGGTNYSNNIAFTNNERNIGKNITFRQGLRFRVDLDDIMDTELNTAYSVNKTTYSSDSYTDRNTQRLQIGLEGRNYFFDDWTLGYDFSHTINSGYNTGNINPTLLNVYVECRFLKGNMGSIRLEGYDLFNENTGITRDVFDNAIVDSQTNRLARYFLLSFNLRLQKFGV